MLQHKCNSPESDWPGIMGRYRSVGYLVSPYSGLDCKIPMPVSPGRVYVLSTGVCSAGCSLAPWPLLLLCCLNFRL